MAINRVWFNDAREKQEETCFVEVELWGKTAEVVGDHCHKGHTIFIEGRLKLDTWDDKTTGQKRSKLRVVAEEFKFVTSPRKDEGGEEPPPRRASSKPKPPVDPDLDQPEDDIPF